MPQSPAGPDAEVSTPPVSLHRNPSFVCFAVMRIFNSAALQMLNVAVGWQVYELTGNPLDLGLVGLAQFLPVLALFLVSGLVADRFNRSATGLTYDLADELLSQRNVDVELRRRYRACLETCDFARFVPASAKSERRSEVLEQALALLAELERAW